MNKSWNKKLWLLYQCVLVLIIGVFLARAIPGEYVTKVSDGQVIHFSKLYQMGKFYDRDENDITDDAMYEDIIEPEISVTMNQKSSVAGVTPWVFGLEDDRFQLENLLNPYEERVGGDAKLTYDSNLMRKVKHLVEEKGYEESPERDEADVVIFNTCSVRDNADKRFFGTLGQLKKIKKSLIKFKGLQF